MRDEIETVLNAYRAPDAADTVVFDGLKAGKNMDEIMNSAAGQPTDLIQSGSRLRWYDLGIGPSKPVQGLEVKPIPPNP
jgi:hypothetical protein